LDQIQTLENPHTRNRSDEGEEDLPNSSAARHHRRRVGCLPPAHGKELRRHLVSERGEAKLPLLLGLARAPAKGAAASPLDGGALTRVGSACVGERAGNGAMLARSPLLLVALS